MMKKIPLFLILAATTLFTALFVESALSQSNRVGGFQAECIRANGSWNVNDCGSTGTHFDLIIFTTTTTTTSSSSTSTTSVWDCSASSQSLCTVSSPIAAGNNGETRTINGGDSRSRTVSCNASTGNWDLVGQTGYCCDSENINLCSEAKTIPNVTNHGGERTISAGFDFQRTYRCEGATGTFTTVSESGSCNPPDCAATTRQVCGVSRSVSSGNANETRTIFGGDSRQRTFICNGSTGSWAFQSQTGYCCDSEGTSICSQAKVIPNVAVVNNEVNVSAGYNYVRRFRCNVNDNNGTFSIVSNSGSCTAPPPSPSPPPPTPPSCAWLKGAVNATKCVDNQIWVIAICGSSSSCTAANNNERKDSIWYTSGTAGSCFPFYGCCPAGKYMAFKTDCRCDCP
jgi:hypothetical protein